MAQQRTNLRGENQLTTRVTPIERLLAQAVAHQMDGAGSTLTKGKGEHAVDLRDRLAHTVSADQLEQDFGIRAIAQRHTVSAQFLGERTVTVYLAIEDQRIAGRLVDARLRATRKVDDREPRMAEGKVGINKDTAAVRAAMAKRAVHRPHYIVRPGAGRGEPGYAAHPSAIGSVSNLATGWAARGWAMAVGRWATRLILWVPSAPRNRC